MGGLPEILDAFERALELERELGTRTVECDRALLTPVSAPRPKAPPVVPQSAATPPRPKAPSVVPQPAAAPVGGSMPDFAFIAVRIPTGAAAEMLDRMIVAMGYTRDAVVVAAAGEAPPRARIYIVLGSDAFRVLAPGQRVALGLWTSVGETPTVVTYSPAKILTYYGNDEAGLKAAKHQIWNDLKSALGRIGRQPPPRA